MADLTSLKKQRGYIKSRLSKFEVFLSKCAQISTESPDFLNLKPQLQYKFKQLSDILTSFESTQSQIELINPEESNLDEREDFETRYFIASNKASEYLSHQTLPDQVPSLNDQLSSSASEQSERPSNFYDHVKLPQIDLPKFTGDQIQWIDFHETFMSLIHENTHLNSIQKFYYLRASLVGEPYDIISSLKLMEVNYEVALGLLRDQYDNKKLLLQNLLKNILNSPSSSQQDPQHLHNLQINLQKSFRALQALGLSYEELWNLTIVTLSTNKLDQNTLLDWKSYQMKIEIPQINNFLEFLKEKSSVLFGLNKKQNTSLSLPSNSNSKSSKPSNTAEHCIICKESHSLFNCNKFNKMSVDDRIVELKKQKRCLNCLKVGHFSSNCSSSCCRKCGEKHNTVLHKTSTTLSKQTLLSSDIRSSFKDETLLPTVLLLIENNDKSSIDCRAILDTGSQTNYITSNLVKKLQLPTYDLNTSISGIGQSTLKITSACKINVTSRINKFSQAMSCLVIPEICNSLPSNEIDLNRLKLPTEIRLADPSFHLPSNVDLLIGAQYFWDILLPEQIKMNSGLLLQKSQYGWLVSGLTKTPSLGSLQCKLSIEHQLHLDLQKFWELESSDSKELNILDECEEHFVKNTSRLENGQFQVAIPFASSPTSLGDSRSLAERRLYALEKRFKQDPKLHQEYVSFMREYEDKGHMSLASNASTTNNYFLPHHGVIKSDSLTTKLRVVFDGSAKTSNGISSNDIQMVGPTIQPDLFSLLINFRLHPIAICADVEKMYRQVMIRPEDRCYQQILWREHPHQNMKTYHLNTVTYGTSSAPFLAIRSLFELGNLTKNLQPDIADIIYNNFYVDDLIMGTDSVSDAIDKCTRLQQVLGTASFNLRKWISNDPFVASSLRQTNETDCYDMTLCSDAKTLGLQWHWRADNFVYQTHLSNSLIEHPTKRNILSAISRIFDPLGLLSPLVIQAKILLQHLWLDKCDWDDPLPNNLKNRWILFCKDFNELQMLNIPRLVICENPDDLQIHGFSDSSQQAYGACIFIRSSSNSNITTRLLCAKTKVAPLKPVSIPRLELQAAVLLIKLLNRTLPSLNLKFSSIILWTDSTTVLAWLKIPPMQLKPFVRNRIYEIQSNSKNVSWRYVGTKDNPADNLTRPVSATKMISLEQWWIGPAWLSHPSETWPKHKFNEHNSSVEAEIKNKTITLLNVVYNCPIEISRFSNFLRLVRSLAYCIRFINNCRVQREKGINGPLTPEEQHSSLIHLIRFVQNEGFQSDINHLKTKKCLHPNSKILSLNPFIDDQDLLRVGGRLENSHLSYDKKHPYLLPSKHHFNILLIRYEHLKNGHAPPEHLLSIVRERFWPIHGRNQIRNVFHNCVRCFRIKPKLTSPFMGNLPSSRIEPHPPFSITGIDYAGPITIRDKLGRNSKTSKAYIALFICLTVRAIHIELVSDLSTDCFLACFRRFTSRRGKPSQVLSDNGTNFIGAKRKLNEVSEFLSKHQNEIITDASNNGIKWSFIPPRAPHFGGLWEAGVKSVKRYLVHILGNAQLNFELLNTVLYQIEAMLNSRPISPLSNDPTDLLPLTPAHFLIGRPLTSLPDINLVDFPINRLNRYQQVQQMTQHFWKRWSKEYLTSLQQRQKWRTHQTNLKVNDLVIVKEENLPPLCWALARIIQVHPGKDGIVRVATLQTSKGIYNRPVSKICVLPIQDNSANNHSE